MRRIGIVAALPGELKPLVRGWRKQGRIWMGKIGDAEAIAACDGMGAQSVTRAVDLVLANGGVEALVSCGWAGSLSCGLKVGGSYAIREVVEAGSGERFPTAYPEGHTLITLDRVADAAEKRRLAQQYKAVLVDMEAATVARIARERGLRFLCFKGVSDGPSDKLPDFNRFTGADGQLRMAAFAAWAAVHPASWRSLAVLARNSRAAAEQLAWFMPQCLRDLR